MAKRFVVCWEIAAAILASVGLFQSGGNLFTFDVETWLERLYEDFINEASNSFAQDRFAFHNRI